MLGTARNESRGRSSVSAGLMTEKKRESNPLATAEARRRVAVCWLSKAETMVLDITLLPYVFIRKANDGKPVKVQNLFTRSPGCLPSSMKKLHTDFGAQAFRLAL
jgi:hypothetical protein